MSKEGVTLGKKKKLEGGVLVIWWQGDPSRGGTPLWPWVKKDEGPGRQEAIRRLNEDGEKYA